MMIEAILSAFQMMIGIVIVAASTVIVAMGCDHKTKAIHRLIMVGLTCWGVWFAWIGYSGYRDSIPAIAFACAIAYVLVFNGRQIRGIIDGEGWWHAPKLKHSQER